MATVDREPVYVEPNFYIPDGMKDFVRDPDAANQVEFDAEALDGTPTTDVDADVTIVDEGDASTSDAPAIPDNLTVISQTIRRLADGTQVVDLVVDVDDVPGVTSYEIRVTKV